MANRNEINGNRTFIKITNKDIYVKLETLETKLTTFCEKNDKEHENMKGRINLDFWIVTGALSLAGTALYLLYTHIGG